MPYTKTTWVDESLSGAIRYDIKEDNGTAFKSTMQIVLSTSVAQSGTALTAAIMNNIENALELLANQGWVSIADTWTYASATTVTVPSNATLSYQKGDRVRLKQGAGYKYYYVTGVTSTVLTLNGGSDYTVANAAITDIAFSRCILPFGFPVAFNWAPTIGGYSANPTSTLYNFHILGGYVYWNIQETGNGTSNAATKTYSPPVTCAAARYSELTAFLDNNTNFTGGVVRLTAGGNIEMFKAAFAAFTASGNCRIVQAQGQYRY